MGLGCGLVLNKRYRIVKKLSAGAYGTVVLAHDVHRFPHNQKVAIKCLPFNKKENSGVSNLPFASLETQFLKKLRFAGHHDLESHPGQGNVIQFLNSFETSTHMFIVLEYCPQGDLYEAITTGRRPRDVEAIRDIMLQLIDAVEFSHLAGIFHRDIKPENVLLTTSPGGKLKVKLGDFGLATTSAWSTEIGTGSNRYQAPEQFDENSEGYSPAKVDLWALGITLLNILFGRNPWKTPSTSDYIFSDYRRDPLSLGDVFPTISPDTFEVLSHALAIDPNKRDLISLRQAVLQVVQWTTDDEDIDTIFLLETTLPTPSLAVLGDRAPLRTPSLQPPTVSWGVAAATLASRDVSNSRNIPFYPIAEVPGVKADLSAVAHSCKALIEPYGSLPSRMTGQPSPPGPSSPTRLSHLKTMMINHGCRRGGYYDKVKSCGQPDSFDSGLGLSLSTLALDNTCKHNSAIPLRDISLKHNQIERHTQVSAQMMSASLPMKTSWHLSLKPHPFSTSWSDMLEEAEQEERMIRQQSISPSDKFNEGDVYHMDALTGGDHENRGSVDQNGHDYWDGLAVGFWEEDKETVAAA